MVVWQNWGARLLDCPVPTHHILTSVSFAAGVYQDTQDRLKCHANWNLDQDFSPSRTPYGYQQIFDQTLKYFQNKARTTRSRSKLWIWGAWILCASLRKSSSTTRVDWTSSSTMQVRSSEGKHGRLASEKSWKFSFPCGSGIVYLANMCGKAIILAHHLTSAGFLSLQRVRG